MLLRPSEALNQVIYGLVARSARLYGMGVCAFVYLSNHCHLLLRPRSAGQLSDFMRYLNGNLAREAGRLHGWREKFWGRRYEPILVSFEPEAQVSRLEYLLAQGCKENLVAAPEDWPGATSIHALKSRQPIRGVWYDRTRLYRARRSPGVPPDDEFAVVETLDLVPLPCWEGLSGEEQGARIEALLQRIRQDSRSRRSSGTKRPLGRKRIQKQHPHRRSRRLLRTPSPGFHTASLEIRRMLEEMHREYRSAYRDAVERLRHSISPTSARFPSHGIPPPRFGC